MKCILPSAGVISLAILATGPARAADSILMMAPTWLGFAPVHVANDLGCFKEKGLEVEYKFEDDRSNVMAAYANGDIEVDMRTVGEHQGRPRDASTPGIIIGTIDESTGGDGVITDGAVKTVADLKGRIVAAEPNIPARLLLQMELKKAGLTLKDLNIKDIATADTAAVFADSSIAAIASYEPFMSQALKVAGRPEARVMFSSSDYRGIIIDVITARQDDLAANPQKYANFLDCVYKAVDYSKAEPDKYAEMAAAHYGLTPAEVKEILATSLTYTNLEEAKTYLGKKGERGTLHDIFDTVMQLNLENGAADNNLDSNQQIDNSVINTLTGQ
jgi:NitT/TauT family transport system substrate-binding protein